MTYKMLLTYFCVVVLVVVICKYNWNVTPPLRLTSIGIGCHSRRVLNFDSNQPTTWVNFEHNHPNRVQWTPSPPSQQPTRLKHGWMNRPQVMLFSAISMKHKIEHMRRNKTKYSVAPPLQQKLSKIKHFHFKVSVDLR